MEFMYKWYLENFECYKYIYCITGMTLLFWKQYIRVKRKENGKNERKKDLLFSFFYMRGIIVSFKSAGQAILNY